MATLIKSTGETLAVAPANGKHFTLEELQTLVGGYIEIIHTDNELIVCNEEGRVFHKPFNGVATQRFHQQGGAHRFLVGDILFCDRKEVR